MMSRLPSEPLQLSCKQVRQVDQIAIENVGMPGLVLMENAGRGVAQLIAAKSSTSDQEILIACGSGNNGGDGFVIARHLDNFGYRVNVMVCGDQDDIRGDAAANLHWLEYTNAKVFRFDEWNASDEPTWVVDALLGTGSRGPLREPYASCVARLNQHPNAKRIAVDLPTGVNADTGEIHDEAFRADFTATFVAIKPGLLEPTARPFVGELHLVDIGVPQQVIDQVRVS